MAAPRSKIELGIHWEHKPSGPLWDSGSCLHNNCYQVTESAGFISPSKNFISWKEHTYTALCHFRSALDAQLPVLSLY